MKNDTIGIPDKVYLHETSKYFDHSKSEHKNKQVGYRVYVDYHVTGYYSGIESDGMHCFYYLTDSVKDALESVLSDFRAYQKVETRDPEGDYYDLNYTITGFSFEKRILD